MAKKDKPKKSKVQAVRSVAENADEIPMQTYQLKIDKNMVVTIGISLDAAPVYGRPPRPKEELLLMLTTALAALLAGKKPKPQKRGFVLDPMTGTPVVGPPRKRVNP